MSGFRLSGSLPQDDRNGVQPISAAMVNDPEALQLIVAVVKCKKITTDCDTGDIIPTAQIRAIEGFSVETADGKQLRRLWQRAYERRTGQTQLPIEVEEELASIIPKDDDK